MLKSPRRFLAFVGRHAARAYAASIFIGLALPQLAAALRPFIPVSIFIFILLSFARAHLPGLQIVVQKPLRLVLAVILSLIVPPLIGWSLLQLPVIAALDPGIRLAIALMAAAPPLMASPVYAALLGFENSFALTTLVLGMVITPLSAPTLATFLAGAAVPISPYALAERLALFVGLGMLAGLALRRIAGVARLESVKQELDGLGVAMFFLFAIAAMDGVIDATLENPLLILLMLALSTGIAALNFAASYALLRHYGFNDRFSISIGISLRNMGLLVAPILAIIPKTTFLYFALAQVPVYVAPVILKALKNKLEPE